MQKRNRCGCGAPRPSGCGVSQPSCQPPTHNETVSVPHHAYTMHKQAHTDNWLTHQLQYNIAPVTQQVSYMEHPPTSACLPRPPCPNRQPPPAVCSPPTHNETVRIPHHIYTVHSQPTIRRWMTHQASCNRAPVTQENRTTGHPTLDACPGSF